MESEKHVKFKIVTTQFENDVLKKEVKKLMKEIPTIDSEDKGFETQLLVLKEANGSLKKQKLMLENGIKEILQKRNTRITECFNPTIIKKEVKMEENESEFLTYKKRSGTDDHGKEYEYLLCAYYALKFCFDEDVSDFNMTTNNVIYGDFDDIQLTLKFKDTTSHTFLIQLKHKQDKKRKLYLRMLNSDDDKNDFNLLKNLKSYTEINKNGIESENISYILFTNMEDSFGEGEESFLWQKKKNVQKVCNSDISIVDTVPEEKKDHTFQFRFTQDGEGSEHEKEFLHNFLLLTRQSNVDKTKVLIDQILIERFGNRIEFTEFMHKWWKQNFVLTKSDVIEKLAELALSPFIKPYKSFQEEKKETKKDEEKEKMEILKKSMEQFDMTLIKNCGNCDINIIENFWSEPISPSDIPRLSKTALKYGINHKEIQNEDELLPEEKTKVLWFLNKAPLIVEYKKSETTRIQNAIKLLGTEAKKKKIILLGYNYSKDEYRGWTIFENLHDLLNSDYYNQVIESFKVSLQKRQSINLKQLIASNEEIAKLIEIEHMLVMVQEDYFIGEKSVALPEAYIPRSVRSADSLKTPIQEKDYFVNSTRLLNIIVGKPGCGKSTFLTYLTSQCPSIYWCVRVNLIKYNSFLRKGPTNEEILRVILKCEDPFADNIVVQLRKDRRIYFLLDGLDEIDSNYLQTILNFINYAASSVGIKVWLSSRENLESKIIKSMNVSLGVSLWKIDELTLEEQKAYIHTRLKNLNENETTVKYSDHEIEKIINKIFNIININNNAKLVLGVPLHLYIITEILRNEKKKPDHLEDIFVLSKMFRMFFKGKRKHQDQKSELQHEEAYDDYDFEYTLQQYQIVALRACLDPTTFKNLKLEESNEVSESQKFLKMIERTGNKLGIISQVYKDEDQIYRARFFHQSFAEYFASVWFVDNIAKLKLIKEDFFSDKCQNLRLIFDITLSEDCPLQLAVLHKIPEEVKKYIQNLTQKDQKFRNVLHLSFSYCEDSFNLRHEEKALLDKRILRKLLKNAPLHILDETDQLFEWNCFDYALKTQSLFPFEVIAEEFGETVSLYIQYLLTRFEDAKLLDCCSRLGYSFLLEAFFRKRGNHKMKLNRDYILQAAIQLMESKEEYFKEKFAEAIQILTHNGCDVNEMDDDGSTPLHIFCQQGDIKKVKALLNCPNINLFAINIYNDKTALHFASESQNTEIVEILIEKGLNVNDLDINKWTPLHYACGFGSCDVVKTLVEHKADINAVTKKNVTMLHLAAQNSKPEIITFLINEGMQVNQLDIDDETPLHYACGFGSCDVVKTLIEKKADINAVTNRNSTMLHLAAQNSKLEIITFLINEGMQVNQLDINNWTPLHYACGFGSCDVVKTLVEHKADINAVTNRNSTMLHLAAQNSKPEIITFLINEGMQVNQLDIDDGTPLHYACGFGSCDVVKTLVEHKADINAVTKKNATMLHFASRNENIDVLEFLLAKGTPINVFDKDKLSPLYCACSVSNYRAVEILLKRGADLDSNCHKNLIENFHKILCLGNVYTVKSLLTKMKKKRIDIKHLSPDFPLHLAKEQDRLQPALLLKMTRHIKEFRQSYGSTNGSDSELYKYLNEKFEYVSPQEVEELISALYG